MSNPLPDSDDEKPTGEVSESILAPSPSSLGNTKEFPEEELEALLGSTPVKRPLLERLKSLPTLPGVYIKKDSGGQVIYVGKAKSLKARVRSYFTKSDTRFNVKYLVSRISEIETVVTEDERQALILENDLIKKYKPRYNIRLKDDKAHLIVRIDRTHPWPRIDLVRKERNDGAKYIGPFAFGYELRTFLDVIRNTLPLRTCSDRILINRVRPCLEYQLKRCAGPCCLEVSQSDYLGWIESAIDILEGKNRDIIGYLRRAMDRASEELRFEDAARLRDQLQVLEKATAEKTTYQFSAGTKDVIGIHRDGENAEVSVLQVRRGRLMNARTFALKEMEIPDDELLGSFLGQFYDSYNEIPEQIILPFALEDQDVRAELYSEKRGSRVEIAVPERGEKHRLVSLAQENARENVLARNSTGEGDPSMRVLKDELGLLQIPRTIECADISHFQGGSTVASVVHFKDGKPDKNRYRHFNLESQEGKPDDFASMLEVVGRHLSRCSEENTLPDLLVIDGGRAQLAKAVEARNAIGLQQPVLIGLAKKRTNRLPYFSVPSARTPRMLYKPERIYVEGKEAPIVLRESSKALHLLERLRDEAHRFAITFHRSTRTNRTFKSLLEDVPGLGDKRRRALLKEFGSIKRIKETAPEELSARSGIPILICQRVITVLNRQPSGESGEL